MDVSLKHPGELTLAEIDAWRALRAGDVVYDNPFFAPEFARAVETVRKDARGDGAWRFGCGRAGVAGAAGVVGSGAADRDA